ncbi:hypothetical protein K470DRAFT_95009 [Piedraia hortae CBS 480.64]|uniref:Uncharacterized protein n=1 Tax=Piedraia hortae CBS 480.64 TaxID=1314780 RepID=A0A6A7BWS1_9PEZI|nr:hypothetical protein K470DRAFT_95009 [Piedraia hortae CBS 480.64]
MSSQRRPLADMSGWSDVKTLSATCHGQHHDDNLPTDLIGQCSACVHDILGNSAAYTSQYPGPLLWLRFLDNLLEKILAEMPIIEPCRMANPSCAGVIRIIDIALETTRAEVIDMMTQYIELVRMPSGSPFFAVHMRSDPENIKTLEAYVEVATLELAKALVEYFEASRQRHVFQYIGNFSVRLQLSSQDALMRALLPSAKISWVDGVPVLWRGNRLVPAAEFEGFITHSELYQMVTLVKESGETSLPYENFITLINKYPWFGHGLVTLRERDLIFDAANFVVKHALQTSQRVTLLQELVVSILTCPGFSMRQKNQVYTQLFDSGHGWLIPTESPSCGGIRDQDHMWPFIVLERHPNCNDETWAAFQSVLMPNSSRGVDISSIRVDYVGCQTIAQAGRAELRALLHALKMRFLPGPTPPRRPQLRQPRAPVAREVSTSHQQSQRNLQRQDKYSPMQLQPQQPQMHEQQQRVEQQRRQQATDPQDINRSIMEPIFSPKPTQGTLRARTARDSAIGHVSRCGRTIITMPTTMTTPNDEGELDPTRPEFVPYLRL